MQEIRGGVFRPEQDFPDWVRVVRRWRHANGLVWSMPVRFYGHDGAWAEGLGIIAPWRR
jgi:ATP sulfurylase